MDGKWHSLSIGEIEEKLNTNAASGLHPGKRVNITPEDARRNSVFLTPRESTFRCIASMFRDPYLIILIVTAFLALIFGRVDLAVPVLIILLINSAVTGFATVKVRRVGEAMQLYSNPTANVIRDEKLYITTSGRVVPGDVVLLSPGDIAPCDLRLVSSDSLCVHEFIRTKKGIEIRISEKNSDHIYTDSDKTNAPDFVNMVYGGSTVKTGTARAIACEVGDRTYIRASNRVINQMGSQEPDILHSFKVYCRIYRIVMAALIIPICLLGIFRLQSLEFIDIFMMATALVCSSLGHGTATAAALINTLGTAELAVRAQNQSVIVKNQKAQDKLCNTDTLLVFGKGAMTDGRLHCESIYTCGKEYMPDSCVNANVYKLCRLLYIYRKAAMYRPVGSDAAESATAAAEGCLDSLIDHLEIDKEEFNLKVKTLTTDRYGSSGNTEKVTAKMADGTSVSVCLSFTSDVLKICGCIKTEFGTVQIHDNQLSEISSKFTTAYRNGKIPLIIISFINDSAIFEGMLVLGEHIDAQAVKTFNNITGMGINIYAFLDTGKPSDIISLTSTGICDSTEDISFADRSRSGLPDIFGEYKAYIGYSAEDIESLVLRLKSQGHTVASIGISDRYYPAMNQCDTVVSFDSFKYSAEDARGVHSGSSENRESVRRASQVMKRRADVLVCRTNGFSGGISGLEDALVNSRRFYGSFVAAMGCVTAFQIMRVLTVLLSVLFGNIYVTAPEILISGMIADILACIAFAAKKSDRKLLMRRSFYIEGGRNIFNSFLPEIVSCASALLISWLVALVLTLAVPEMIIGNNTFVFFSILLIQMCAVTHSYCKGLSKNAKNSHSAYVTFILVCFAVMLLGLFSKSVSAVIGCNGMNIIYLPLSATGPVIYFSTYYGFSAFSRKNKFK